MSDDKGRPEEGKIYALTGGAGRPSIANGNTWAESEVEPTDKVSDEEAEADREWDEHWAEQDRQNAARSSE